MFDFWIDGQSGAARSGALTLPHGTVETPVFMPVGTQATVRTLSPADLKAVGAQIVLANTYHLHVRPGEDVIAQLGGLHKFMAWERPLLTDSGGFQVFSLEGFRKVDEDGVEFQSHVDGGRRKLTPETAIEIQAKLGGDKFQVVAVNIDTRNLDKPKTWLEEVGIKQLGNYADPSAKVFQDLKAIGNYSYYYYYYQAYGQDSAEAMKGAQPEMVGKP